jgi:hypothetical protein
VDCQWIGAIAYGVRVLFNGLHAYKSIVNKLFDVIDLVVSCSSLRMRDVIFFDCRVLKMMRGSTGLGVWKLENSATAGTILMTDAYDQTTEELPRAEIIPKFLSLCKEDAISMPFLPLIKDGEFRFLMSKHRVIALDVLRTI